MRVVIYAHDFEPITVVELPILAVEHLKRQGRVALAIQVRVDWANLKPGEKISAEAGPRKILLNAERISVAGNDNLIIFTKDEVDALLLKAAFLPGQLPVMQAAEKAAFAEGFNTALKQLGD